MLIRIRIQTFTLLRIWIQLPKIMPITCVSDPVSYFFKEDGSGYESRTRSRENLWYRYRTVETFRVSKNLSLSVMTLFCPGLRIRTFFRTRSFPGFLGCGSRLWFVMTNQKVNNSSRVLKILKTFHGKDWNRIQEEKGLWKFIMELLSH